jgi:C-terminal processing protease CtpA/Prc
MKVFFLTLVSLLLSFGSLSAFAPTLQKSSTWSSSSSSSSDSNSALSMAENNDDLLRWAKSARSASSEDTVVTLLRPLGLVLNQDESGNVYVETVAPKGNAARTGKVKEGDLVTMCSATFGDQMWSTRGVGLSRVLAAIRVRAGPNVKLVFESPQQYKKKAAMTQQQRKAMEEAKVVAQKKKDQLLDELEQDEEKLKRGKFFGLF